MNIYRNPFYSVLTFATALGLASCSDVQVDLDIPAAAPGSIIASIGETSASRTAIDPASNPSEGTVGMLWSADDAIGVFARTGIQAEYVATDRGAKVAFIPKSTSISSPYYAYYPYNSANDGKTAAETLTGTVPATQDLASGEIEGDYKIGRATSTDANGNHYFEFNHLFSLVQVDVDATAIEALKGDRLDHITLTVSRGGSPVAIAGDFEFSTRRFGYRTKSTVNTVSLTWNGQPLSEQIKGYASLFPEIRRGDELSFAIVTDNHKATFDVTSKVDFEREAIYNFPIDLSNPELLKSVTIKDNDGNVIFPETPVDPTPEPLTGTFTCATYNVDGLPNILGINSDGPGHDGTKVMGSKINSEYKWDFFGVSEDFDNHDDLTGALTAYNSGTWRGNVSATGNKNTDGLGFFWKKEGISVSGESWTAFNKSAGGITQGANTLISKGYRYYLVTLADGTEIDVYITHMNTYGSGARMKAQHAQLTQIADAILANNNGRPIIFMGDTNLRYTRHEILSRLINRINSAEGWSINDPWIDYQWDGDYEGVSNHGKSIMAFGPNKDTNAETDDFGPTGQGYGYQKGEIVDKVFYINRTSNKTQLKANGYLVDESYGSIDGKAFGDHYPVVIEFTYTTSK